MKTRNAGMALLLLSVVWAVPAAADMPKGAVGGSHQGYTDDISRAMHEQRVTNREHGIVAPVTGSRYRGMTTTSGARVSNNSTYWLQQAAQAHNTAIALNRGNETDLALLEFMPVTDSRGNHLGTVIRVDQEARLAEVYMGAEGKSVAMPIELLTPKADFAQAVTVSKQDALAMQQTQAKTYFAFAD